MPLFPFASDNSYTHLAHVVKQMVSLGGKNEVNRFRWLSQLCEDECKRLFVSHGPLDVTLRQKPSLGQGQHASS